MSEPATEVPTWTLGWRLQRALDYAGLSAQEMADELSVSRSTISRWLHDHGTPPRPLYLRVWATRCRVPMVWLVHGEAGLPRVDSNHQPTGSGLESPTARETSPTTAEIVAFRRTIRPRVSHEQVTHPWPPS